MKRVSQLKAQVGKMKAGSHGPGCRRAVWPSASSASVRQPRARSRKSRSSRAVMSLQELLAAGAAGAVGASRAGATSRFLSTARTRGALDGKGGSGPGSHSEQGSFEVLLILRGDGRVVVGGYVNSDIILRIALVGPGSVGDRS